MKHKTTVIRWSLAATMVTTFLVSSAPMSSVNAQKAPVRIYFERGATRARVTGYLRGIKDESVFVLRARAGQHMRVDIRGRGPTRGVVMFPNGQQDGSPGGVVFDGTLPVTGDYRIRVTESSMAEAWSGSFTLVIDALPAGADKARDLKQYWGKYPSELFRGEPGLKTRIRALLGANYSLFFERMQTEAPIENDDGVLIARGCRAHECTIEESILAIDVGAGVIHVSIKSAGFRGQFRTWSEGRAKIPDALRRAMKN